MNSRTSPSNGKNEDASIYWQLFRDLPDALLLFDVTTPEFRIVDINKTREKLSSIRRGDVVGRPLFDVFPDVSRKFRETGVNELRGHIEEVIATGKTKQVDAFRYDTILKRGKREARYWQFTYRPILDKEKRVQYVLSTIRDMTDEVRSVRRAKSLERQLKAALEIGKVGSWLWDVAEDMITSDDSLAKLFHLNKRQQMAGTQMKDFLAAIYPEDKERIERAIERTINERVPFEEEFRYTRRDGMRSWILARGEVEDHDGKLVVPGVMVDTTERNDLRAEVELAHQQDELNRRAARILQQRNEELMAIGRSKDEFVALASHQLRTPATAVKQYLGMVLQGYAGDVTDVQMDMLEKAFESNERQIQIINQILNAARADTGRLVMAPVLVDLRTLIGGVWNEMKATFDQHHHHYSLELPSTPMRVNADQAYVRMAIENVLSNACLYTQDGGTITATLTREGDNCRFSVTDTGVGIRRSDFGKLFAKFSRIPNPMSVQVGGSGIGLYLTAEIVRLHRGTVEVESRLYRGTTFAILLPLVHNKKQDQRKGG